MHFHAPDLLQQFIQLLGIIGIHCIVRDWPRDSMRPRHVFFASHYTRSKTQSRREAWPVGGHGQNRHANGLGDPTERGGVHVATQARAKLGC